MNIDFHTHILPNIDDGSHSVQESLEMLLSLKEQGVDVVVATPHYYADEEGPEIFFKKRRFAVAKLKDALIKTRLEVPMIYVGAEVAYYDSIGQMENLSSFCIAGSSYLLLEMPFRRWSDHVLEEVQTIVNRSITPIIAHVDRYECFHRKREMEKLLSNGAKIQLNCDVFEKIPDLFWAKKWINKGYIHCLGSDCHNMTTRKPNFAHALQKCGTATFLTIKTDI